MTTLNFYKTQKLNFWQNSKNWIVTKLKNSNCYKTQTMTNLNLWGEKLKGSFSRKNWTPWQAMRYTLGSILRSRNFFRCHSNLLTTIQTVESLSWSYSHGVANSTVCVVLQKISWYLNNRKGNIFFNKVNFCLLLGY